LIRIVIEQTGPVLARRLRQQFLFRFNRLYWIKKLLPQAARENWTCLFYHDPDQPLGRIVKEDEKLRAVESK